MRSCCADWIGKALLASKCRGSFRSLLILEYVSDVKRECVYNGPGDSRKTEAEDKVEGQ